MKRWIVKEDIEGTYVTDEYGTYSCMCCHKEKTEPCMVGQKWYDCCVDECICLSCLNKILSKLKQEE